MKYFKMVTNDSSWVYIITTHDLVALDLIKGAAEVSEARFLRASDTVRPTPLNSGLSSDEFDDLR